MIGVFDSGLGGLTVLKEITKVLPEYDYLYFGDTLHVPYGNRSDKAIYDLTKNACDYLFDHGCKLIIIACNTATAKALRRLQQEYLPARNIRMGDLHRSLPPTQIPRFPRDDSFGGHGDSLGMTRAGEQVALNKLNILGVIRPVAEEIARLKTRRIGVIGTRGTVNSESYVIELKKLDERLSVVQQACPLLVPMIEEGWMKRKETKSILRYYLRPLKNAQVETLILGCTHYPILLQQIRNIMGKKCFVPNPGEIVARSLKDYLVRHSEIEKQLSKNGTQQYFVTDLNDNFKRIASCFLDKKIEIKEIT